MAKPKQWAVRVILRDGSRRLVGPFASRAAAAASAQSGPQVISSHVTAVSGYTGVPRVLSSKPAPRSGDAPPPPPGPSTGTETLHYRGDGGSNAFLLQPTQGAVDYETLALVLEGSPLDLGTDYTVDEDAGVILLNNGPNLFDQLDATFDWSGVSLNSNVTVTSAVSPDNGYITLTGTNFDDPRAQYGYMLTENEDSFSPTNLNFDENSNGSLQDETTATTWTFGSEDLAGFDWLYLFLYDNDNNYYPLLPIVVFEPPLSVAQMSPVTGDMTVDVYHSDSPGQLIVPAGPTTDMTDIGYIRIRFDNTDVLLAADNPDVTVSSAEWVIDGLDPDTYVQSVTPYYANGVAVGQFYYGYEGIQPRTFPPVINSSASNNNNELTLTGLHLLSQLANIFGVTDTTGPTTYNEWLDLAVPFPDVWVTQTDTEFTFVDARLSGKTITSMYATRTGNQNDQRLVDFPDVTVL